MNSTSQIRSRRLLTILAGTGTVGMVSQDADAADLFYSGILTTNNVVGWANNVALSTDPFNLTIQGLAGGKITKSASATFAGVVIAQVDANGYFRVATSTRKINTNSLFTAAKLNAAGKTWATAATNTKNYGKIGLLNPAGNVGPSLTNQQSYLLFEFKDSTAGNGMRYGWIDATINNNGNNANRNVNVTINSYAWGAVDQKLGAGVIPQPVPEPSTLVTSGIAALAGGAVALRRWRRERKQDAVA
ncbi:MAG: PEP-CTERM sorting domain-containing protein [Planctomycetota bacterium]|nr:MAG: PEP-CTERM sorting domain-containing protein [Planctomycetota bacterium]